MNAGMLEQGQVILTDNGVATVISNEMLCGDFGFYSQITIDQNGAVAVLEVAPRKHFEVVA